MGFGSPKVFLIVILLIDLALSGFLVTVAIPKFRRKRSAVIVGIVAAQVLLGLAVTALVFLVEGGNSHLE